MSLRLEENYALTTEGLSGNEKVPPSCFTHSSKMHLPMLKEITMDSNLCVKNSQLIPTLYFSSTSSEKIPLHLTESASAQKYIQNSLEEFSPVDGQSINTMKMVLVVKVEVING